VPWSPITLDHVRAVVQQARIDRAADADGDGQLELYFRLYHDGTVAAIRSRIATSHDLDADPTKLPPEFILLAALRIANILVGRPGAGPTDGVDPYKLSAGQLDELKRLEAQPENSPAATTGEPSPVILEPTRYWDRNSQDGIGAY